MQISTLPGLFQSGAQSSKLTFKPAPLLLDSQGRQIDETGKVRTHRTVHSMPELRGSQRGTPFGSAILFGACD